MFQLSKACTSSRKDLSSAFCLASCHEIFADSGLVCISYPTGQTEQSKICTVQSNVCGLTSHHHIMSGQQTQTDRPQIEVSFLSIHLIHATAK